MERLYSDLSEYLVFDKTKYQMEAFFTDLRTFKYQFTEAYESIQREKYADLNCENHKNKSITMTLHKSLILNHWYCSYGIGEP